LLVAGVLGAGNAVIGVLLVVNATATGVRVGGGGVAVVLGAWVEVVAPGVDATRQACIWALDQVVRASSVVVALVVPDAVKVVLVVWSH
jgi:hypothetical protein